MNKILKKSVLQIIFSILYFISIPVYSQEIKCQIQVNSSQIQGSDKTVYEAMQKNLFEFVNNRNWTKNVFTIEERIECNIMINLSKQLSVDEFEGTMQVNASRPIYNTGYSSPLVVIQDKKIRFRYAEGQSLDFSETSHNELTSLIAYYIYIVLGFDYDSFSPMGGTEFFQIAEKIVSTAQSSTSGGWKAFEDQKNRYWLVENMMNQIYAPLRNYSYIYHRKGLDEMTKSLTDARTKMVEGLQELLKIHRSKPNSYSMQLFFDAKSDEMIKLFSECPTTEAMRAYNFLKEINAANSAKYQKIIKKE